MGNSERYALDDTGTNAYDGHWFEEMTKVIEEDLCDCPQLF